VTDIRAVKMKDLAQGRWYVFGHAHNIIYRKLGIPHDPIPLDRVRFTYRIAKGRMFIRGKLIK
jgi:hypothetical protein